MSHAMPVQGHYRPDVRFNGPVSPWDMPAGDWFFTTRAGDEPGAIESIAYMCPCGCGQFMTLPIRPQEQGPSWAWDGNRETPTLDPSIRLLDGCKWHGYLKAGVWTPCDDSGR